MSLQRQLSIMDGLPLAIGSIIGSGILFLPSMIFAVSGNNIGYVWALMTILCFPLLEIFNDFVKKIPEASGIQGFVALGLGQRIGMTVPILFLGTVGIGMPTAAIIAGDYLCQLIHASHSVAWITAVFIISIGTISNLLGTKIGTLIQSIITSLLFLIGFGLIFSHGSAITTALPSFMSTFQYQSILPGMLIAMWAFAGFENLTFIAGEFKHPATDFRLCAYIALIVCGILYLGLSLAYAVTTNPSSASVSSLYALALTIHPISLATISIVAFALICVQVNTNSWIWGISRLIYSSASKHILPSYFNQLNQKHIPARAIYLLAIIYGVTFFVYAIYPTLLYQAVPLVSTNFIFIYALTLLSYVRYKSHSILKYIAVLLLLFFLTLLLHAGWLAMYSIALFTCSILYFKLKQNSHKKTTALPTILT